MPKEFSRAERVGELLQRKLAQYIQTELKDPRITGLVTITEVKVSPDFAYAKVFVTVMGSDAQEQPDTVVYLNEAAGYLRKLVGGDIKLRVTPHLKFIYDDTIAYGNRLSQLINDAVAKENDDEQDED